MTDMESMEMCMSMCMSMSGAHLLGLRVLHAGHGVHVYVHGYVHVDVHVYVRRPPPWPARPP